MVVSLQGLPECWRAQPGSCGCSWALQHSDRDPWREKKTPEPGSQEHARTPTPAEPSLGAPLPQHLQKGCAVEMHAAGPGLSWAREHGRHGSGRGGYALAAMSAGEIVAPIGTGLYIGGCTEMTVFVGLAVVEVYRTTGSDWVRAPRSATLPPPLDSTAAATSPLSASATATAEATIRLRLPRPSRTGAPASTDPSARRCNSQSAPARTPCTRNKLPIGAPALTDRSESRMARMATPSQSAPTRTPAPAKKGKGTRTRTKPRQPKRRREEGRVGRDKSAPPCQEPSEVECEPLKIVSGPGHLRISQPRLKKNSKLWAHLGTRKGPESHPGPNTWTSAC